MKKTSGIAAVVVALAVLLGACAPSSEPAADGVEDVTTQAPDTGLPDGWRWESFDGIEVGVPDDFGWTSGTQAVAQWCVGGSSTPPLNRQVGRPGPTTLVGCPDNPAQQAQKLGTFVSLDSSVGAAELKTPGVPDVVADEYATTWRNERVTVTVWGAADLRAQIIGTVRIVETTDANGCPIDETPGPDPDGEAARIAPVDVATIAVCQVTDVDDLDFAGPAFLGSRVIEGAAAQQLLSDIRQGRRGGQQVAGQSSSSLIVLRVSTNDGDVGRILMRYAGPVAGFDDGRTVYGLTRPATTAIFQGPIRLDAFPSELQDVVPAR